MNTSHIIYEVLYFYFLTISRLSKENLCIINPRPYAYDGSKYTQCRSKFVLQHSHRQCLRNHIDYNDSKYALSKFEFIFIMNLSDKQLKLQSPEANNKFIYNMNLSGNQINQQIHL